MTFTIKHRGAGGLMVAEYLCPVHGRFELLVNRDDEGDPPDAVRCNRYDELLNDLCTKEAEYAISAPSVHTQFVISATQGKSAAKPHRDAMDTRMLTEGRKKEFRQQRKAVREAARKRRVMELLK